MEKVRSLVLAVLALLSVNLAYGQQPAVAVFDRMASLDLLQDPDMGRALEEESLGPFSFGLLRGMPAGIVQVKQPNTTDGWTLGFIGAAAASWPSHEQLLGVGFWLPRPLQEISWLGLSIVFSHRTITKVPQDILGPIFPDSQEAIAVPDPYSNRDDYEADLAAGVSIPDQYLMSYDLYNVSLGANLGIAIPQSFGMVRFQAGWDPQVRYVAYDATLYRPFEAVLRADTEAWRVVDRIVIGAYVDGRNTFREPTQGFYLGQTVTLAGGFLLGARDFIQTDTRLEGFLTLVRMPIDQSTGFMLVLAAHSELSLILPNYSLSSHAFETNVDSTQQLVIDGMSVGRGWIDLPQPYGDALWDNKLELRVPMGVVWLVGFLEAVALWQEPFQSPPGDLFHYSFGLGLRLSSPTFPIRVYIVSGFMVWNGQLVWAKGGLNIGNLSFGLVITTAGGSF